MNITQISKINIIKIQEYRPQFLTQSLKIQVLHSVLYISLEASCTLLHLGLHVGQNLLYPFDMCASPL